MSGSTVRLSDLALLRSPLRGGFLRACAGIAVAALAAIFLPAPASAQVTATVTAAASTLDQNTSVLLTATTNPATACTVPCYWTWTVTGPGVNTTNTSIGAVGSTGTYWMYYPPLIPGVFTITVSRPGVSAGSTQITIRPMVITLAGQQQIPQGETTHITATLSGIQARGGWQSYVDSSIQWTLSGDGFQIPDSTCSSCQSQATTVTAGHTAGPLLLTAQSVLEPTVSSSIVLTVLPPPVVSIAPASLSFAPSPPGVSPGGNPACFSGTATNTSQQGLFFWTDDPTATINTNPPGTATCIYHWAHQPGGQFHVFATSYAGGSMATATMTVVAVSLSPTSVVVPPVTSRQFVSAVTGSQQVLQWSTTVPGATISANGLLKVPAGTPAGAYTVSAQTVGGPATALETATVTVASTIPVSAVVVSPALSVIDSGQQEPFAAVVGGQNGELHPNQGVTWSVSGPSPATIAANGVFTAPSVPGVYTVQAVSLADGTKTGSATVTVGEDLLILPSFASLAPGASQPFQAQVTGSSPTVTWSVQEGAAGGTVSSTGLYTAPSTAGIYHVVAVASASGVAVQGIATVVVGADAPVSVRVTPAEAQMARGAVQSFAATVTGAVDTTVAWSASAGTIDPTGVFTAPATLGTVTITATSHADGRIRGLATVVVTDTSQAQAFSYDANGNLLSDGARTYEWDAEDRLIAINVGAHRSELGYDGFGHRVMIVEKDGGSITSKRHYIWAGDEIAEERDATATSATIPTSLPSRLRPTEPKPDGEVWVGEAESVGALAVATPSGDNAVFVSQAVPATMTAGGVYRVSVTLTNTGSTTWTAASGYKLGSINPQNNAIWGVSRVVLGAGESIAPGQQKTFSWNVTAPAAAGTYNLQWQLLQENVAWIGDPATNVSVTVASGSTANLAQFIAQSVPASMVTGGVYTVSVTMQNAGTSPWTAAASYRLGSENPQNNGTWGLGRVYLGAGESIAQGQQKTFTFTVTAPATAGTYNFQWRMVQDGVAWISNTAPNVAVSVVSASNARLAQFVSQSVPAVMSAGASYSVSVTFGNAGTSAWTAANSYRLGSSNPQNNGTWGVGRVYLGSGESIAQGQQKTFTFTVTAPTTPGTYDFQWQMVQDGVAWFGDLTPNLSISVTLPVEPVLTRFFPGGMVVGSTNYYFSYDHLGSVRDVTDSNGALISRYTYDPFGRLTVGLGTPPRFGFAGTFYHAASGLDLTEYRAYDPDLGRWATRDKAAELTSEDASLYSYVDNDPVDFIDPQGLIKLPADPSGLPSDWTLDTKGQHPNGEKYVNPDGDTLEFHKGKPGEPKWGGRDHWHYWPGGRRNPNRNPNYGKKHLPPGTDVPEIQCTPKPLPFTIIPTLLRPLFHFEILFPKSPWLPFPQAPALPVGMPEPLPLPIY